MGDAVIESDIIIDFLKGVEGARQVLAEAAGEGLAMVSAISAAEVMAAGGERNSEATASLLDSMGVVPVEKEVAFLAGEYLADSAGDGLLLRDCLVASCAGRLGAILVTLGERSYPEGVPVRRVSYERKS